MSQPKYVKIDYLDPILWLKDGSSLKLDRVFGSLAFYGVDSQQPWPMYDHPKVKMWKEQLKFITDSGALWVEEGDSWKLVELSSIREISFTLGHCWKKLNTPITTGCQALQEPPLYDEPKFGIIFPNPEDCLVDK